MMKKVLLTFFISISLFTTAQQNYIELQEIVTDKAQIFTQDQLKYLKNKLVDFEAKTTHQLVILTIPRLGNETIETYANNTFEHNELGYKDKDNGILILFSNIDRKVRIEVGYGLEYYITDAIASIIIRNIMIPKFKEKQYFEGIDMAINQIITILTSPEALNEFKKKQKTGKDKNRPHILTILFLALMVMLLSYKPYGQLIEICRGVLMGKLGFFYSIKMTISSLFRFFRFYVVIFLLFIFNITIFLNLSLFKYTIYELIFFFSLAPVIASVKIIFFRNDDLNISWFENDDIYLSKTYSSSSGSFYSSKNSSKGFSGRGGSSGGGGASGEW